MSVEDDLPITRKYQDEIFQRAIKENVIVALETGGGKTMIAILLIKYMASLPVPRHAPSQIIFFLVPKVPLVFQHAATLREQTSLAVKELVGSMGVDLWDSQKWAEELADAEVVVLTSAIFYHLIAHGRLTLSRVPLLVFDEAHHCRKNDIYNKIMRDFYDHTDVAERPKIFGMTASPIYSVKQPQKSLEELEKNLDAKIIAVKENVDELAKFLPKPKEVLCQYAPIGDLVERFHAHLKENNLTSLDEDLISAGRDIVNSVDWEKMENRTIAAQNNLGPLAAEYYMIQHLKEKFDASLNQTFGGGIHDYNHLLLDSEESTALKEATTQYDGGESHAREMTPAATDPFVDVLVPGPIRLEKSYAARKRHDTTRSLKSVLQAHVKRMDTLRGDDIRTWLSPKVLALFQVLQDHHTEKTLQKEAGSFQTIIFVSQRHVAVALSWLMRGVLPEYDWIKAGVLTGQGSANNSNYPHTAKKGPSNAKPAKMDASGMSQRNQAQVIEDFRSGKLNVLITTAVAEEGLDFQPCNLVIRFDPLETMVSYMQSRGRARHRDSTYVIMYQGEEMLEKYHLFSSSESSLKEHYVSFQDNKADNPVDSGEDAHLIDLDRQLEERFVVEETGAVLTYQIAMSLLYQLCQSVSSDEFHTGYLPIMETLDFSVAELEELPFALEPGTTTLYACRITLPPTLPLTFSERVFQGGMRLTKSAAKRCAAYTVVLALYRIDCLDKHLLPFRQAKKKGDEDIGENADGVIPDMIELPVTLYTNVPDVWGNPWLEDTKRVTLHLHVVSSGGTRMGMLCAQSFMSLLEPIEEGLFHFNSGLGPVDVAIDETAQVVLCEADFVLLNEYSRHLFGQASAKWRCKAELVLFLAPLIDERTIDWAFIKAALINPWTPSASSLTSSWSAMSEKERQEVVVRSPGPGFKHHVYQCHAIFETALEHDGAERYIGHLDGEEMVVLSDTPLGPKEVLVQLTPLPKLRNPFVDKETAIPKTSTTRLPPFTPKETAKEFFYAPLAKVHTSPFAYSTFLLTRLMPALLRRITELFRLRTLERKLAIAPLPAHCGIAALTLPSAGVPYDYERLETLGDSLMKLCTTLHVYTKYRHKHEGQLHVLRKNSIHNMFLQSTAVRLAIPHHMSKELMRVIRWNVPHAGDRFYSQNEDVLARIKGEGRYTVCVRREIPRRALSDIIESLLGAAYLSPLPRKPVEEALGEEEEPEEGELEDEEGEMEEEETVKEEDAMPPPNMASVLDLGTKLGLCFGTVWQEALFLKQFGQPPKQEETAVAVPASLKRLQAQLQYDFKNPRLLLEALTHPSMMQSEVPCYQRLEFMGDAVIEFYVVQYLFHHFPTAAPGQISWLKQVLVCNATLGAIAVKALSLHQYLLFGFNAPMIRALREEVPALVAMKESTIMENTWLLNPPKMLNDVLESVIGAIFIDSKYDVQVVFGILQRCMAPFLAQLKIDFEREPLTELLMLMERYGCRASKVVIGRQNEQSQTDDVATLYIHGQLVASKAASNGIRARNLVAREAMTWLKDETHPFGLAALCTCQQRGKSKITVDQIVHDATTDYSSSPKRPREPQEDDVLPFTDLPALDESAMTLHDEKMDQGKVIDLGYVPLISLFLAKLELKKSNPGAAMAKTVRAVCPLL